MCDKNAQSTANCCNCSCATLQHHFVRSFQCAVGRQRVHQRVVQRGEEQDLLVPINDRYWGGNDLHKLKKQLPV